MKKLILIICIMFSVYSTVNAQITIGRKNNFETIAKCRTGYVSLKCQYYGDSLQYNSYYISLPTTNQFDNNIIINLGNDKESAIKTIDDLISLISYLKKGDYLDIIDASNERLTVSKVMGSLHFNKSGYAGIGGIMKFELEKLRNALVKYNK